VSSYFEIWAPEGRLVRSLEVERLTVGKAADSGIVLEGDPTISGVHAVIERYGDHWSIRDMGSRNGTFVNGERLWGERQLRGGDEILIGRTRMTYSAEGQSSMGLTEAAQPAPDLTRREREVLVLLCQPLGSGDIFTEPATTKQIARKLVVTEAAVKQHLSSLYDKFGIHDHEERRRVRLANEAIRRGAVSAADLKTAGRS
jgi:DNA-binding CsgD family transcriptional regulator